MNATTLARHELAGLPVRVTAASDDARVGTAGRVLDETTNTLSVATTDGKRTVPKAGTTFAFDITAVPNPGAWPVDGRTRTDTGAAPDATTVEIDGRRLVERPARRTKEGARPTWH